MMTSRMPIRRMTGFSLVEMMITILILTLVSAGDVSYYSDLKQISRAQDLSFAVDDNLRVGIKSLAATLRGAGYDVPPGNPSGWVNWVTGFSANPMLTDGGGTAPDRLSVASCTGLPVAQLAANAGLGATTLTLSDINAPVGDTPNDIRDDINISSNRKLINIGDSSPALVTAVNSATQIVIDTDPATVGNQGNTTTGPVKIYLTGNGSLSGGTIANASSIPANLQIFSSGAKLDVSGSSTLYMLSYAPSTSLKISAAIKYFGTAIGSDVTLSGGTKFYDDICSGGGSASKISGWHEVAL